jgi:hypothetical protein
MTSISPSAANIPSKCAQKSVCAAFRRGIATKFRVDRYSDSSRPSFSCARTSAEWVSDRRQKIAINRVQLPSLLRVKLRRATTSAQSARLGNPHRDIVSVPPQRSDVLACRWQVRRKRDGGEFFRNRCHAQYCVTNPRGHQIGH